VVYLSGLKGMLVARVDAIEIELCVLLGPVKTTRASSVTVFRIALLATQDSVATMLLVSVDLVGSVGSVGKRPRARLDGGVARDVEAC
jgi:hypothetical protein